MVSTENKRDNYICVSVHERSCDAPSASPLYEERITLIKADSDQEAREKASELVGQARHTYKNEEGDTITWICKRIFHVMPMVDVAFTDGAEIYGRYFRELTEYERFEAHVMGMH